MTTRALSEEQRAEVARLIETQGRIHAVVFLREATGATLAEAMETVRTIAEIAGQNRDRPADRPAAEIIAVGPFTAALSSHLEYPAPSYAGIPEGTPIITTPFWAMGAEDVDSLASCFGIDPWDFNAHALSLDQLDRAAVRALYAEEADDFIAKLEALDAAGFAFTFFLDPNDR